MFALVYLAQQVFGPLVPAELRAPTPQAARQTCPPATSSQDITVCARAGPDQRLKPLPDRDAAATDAVGFRLPGGGSATLRADQSNVGGFTGPAAKVTIRIPFGKGKRD